MRSAAHHLEICSGHLNTQRLDVGCLFDRIDRFGDQVIAVNLDLVGRALTNRFPKCLKLPRRIDLLVELTSAAFALLFHELQFSLSLRTDYVFAMFTCLQLYFLIPFGSRSLRDFC